jgi:hypothetical protein
MPCVYSSSFSIYEQFTDWLCESKDRILIPVPLRKKAKAWMPSKCLSGTRWVWSWARTGFDTTTTRVGRDATSARKIRHNVLYKAWTDRRSYTQCKVYARCFINCNCFKSCIHCAVTVADHTLAATLTVGSYRRKTRSWVPQGLHAKTVVLTDWLAVSCEVTWTWNCTCRLGEYGKIILK